MVLWGLVSTATAGALNFPGLLVCRFFLGFVEAPYFPGCLFYLSMWYTRKELAFRTALLYSGSTIAGAFSGLIAAGIIGGMDGTLGLRAWRWLFIIEGAATVLIALCFIPLLPDFPSTTKWLSVEEKQLATWRLAEEMERKTEDSHGPEGFWTGFMLAIKDKKTWILVSRRWIMLGYACCQDF